MHERKIPMRQCLGCRTQRPKRELIRAVRSPEGEITLDFKGKAVERAFDCAVPEAVYDALEARMEEETDGA